MYNLQQALREIQKGVLEAVKVLSARISVLEANPNEVAELKERITNLEKELKAAREEPKVIHYHYASPAPLFPVTPPLGPTYPSPYTTWCNDRHTSGNPV